MTTLYGAVHLLRRASTTRETRKDLLDTIALDAARLVRFLEDLLAVVEATAGNVRTEPMLLQRLVGEVALDLVSELPDARIRLAVARDLGPVDGDPIAARHALANILRHAIAGSAPRAAVEVVVQQVRRMVVVSVFDRPARGSTGSSGRSLLRQPDQASEPGGRLWLAAAEALITAMGGRMSLVPRGDGHEIRVLLPLTPT